MDFTKELKEYKEYFEKELYTAFDIDNSAYNKTIYDSMKYSITAGGKRLRPVLLLKTYGMFSADTENAVPFAKAMEMIHTYSLIHDDLPAMDDDDFRRGKPTNHKVFDEGISILAGDGLLNLAFETMLEGSLGANLDASRSLQAMEIIANAAGVNGMIGGQVVDLESEGKKVEKDTLDYIHNHKTSALLEASINAGAILGGANEDELIALDTYGKSIGLAFQIVDDILDIVGDIDKLGKDIGSDVENGKATYVSIYGLEESRKMVDKLIDTAIECLEIFGDKAEFLKALAIYLKDRDY